MPASISYPDDLPVARERERILAALRDHPVLVLAGDTGSGKTTQLPKLCLELGRGVEGMIGHTQPRRIAAQAVAARLAEELGTQDDSRVAAQIRFQDRSTADTLIKVITDGILLAEIPRDRKLRRYDTIIIDEAHERSLNIDFLLGYLKRLLPERPDLKLIITSATIDVQRFAQHFEGAPVIEVSGRTWPVEVWYRPPAEQEPELPQAIVGAIEELLAHERTATFTGSGDILVFHAGEREIRESALAIRRANIPNLEVLPLYSRLPQAEQARVLRPATRAGRRVVLTTNVAETSLTVPGIRYVIDPGLARISRYSVRSKVQRLPIEAVSQASANQRKGRCGRLSDGICVRLYAEDDFAQRPAFTEPEILRTNLAAVVLQMHALGLGEVGRFPFLEPPEERQVNDGVRLLEELGAIRGRALTGIGRNLARLPVDPRLGRMLLAGAERGALAETLVIASFLSIQDPRERPPEKQQAADQSHRRFACDTSDFVGMLKLWAYAEEQRQALSANAWRRGCQKEFLSFLRLREWRDVHLQLRLLCRELGLRENATPAHPDALHRAVMAGLLSHIGTRTEERDYEGVRGRRFAVHPGSALFRTQPKWVVAAELVETTRLYARHCAAIQPEWVFPYAEPLVKREHLSPHWSAKSGKVLATERVRLYGLLVSDNRRVDFARLDPIEARRIFIQSALVEGDYRSRRRFWEHNRALLAEIEDLEARGRRRDLLVEDRVRFDWYDERLPVEVCDHPSLEKWLGRTLPHQPEVLCMPRELLLRDVGTEPGRAQFPDALELEGLRVPLSYRYEPGHPADGVTAVLPLALLERFPRHLPEWLVPGLLRDKLVAMLKALPKQYRKPLVPVPDTAEMLLGALRPADRPLAECVADLLRERLRLAIPREAWDEAALDPFYRMNLRLVVTDGTVVAEGRDHDALRAGWIERSRGEVQRAVPVRLAREGIRSWDFGVLPAKVIVKGAGLDMPAVPVLRDRGDSVAIETLTDTAVAELVHREGLRRLLLLDDSQGVSWLRRNLLRDARAVLVLGQRIGREALVDDILLAAAGDGIPVDSELPRDVAAFAALASVTRAQLAARAMEMEQLAARISRELQGIAGLRRRIEQPLFAAARADIDAQLDRLLAKGFLAATPPMWRARLPVYLAAIGGRMERLGQRLARDSECTRELAELLARLEQWRARYAGGDVARTVAAEEYRWMLEEYRVSLFAQQLGTLGPVSRKRLDRLWEAVIG